MNIETLTELKKEIEKCHCDLRIGQVICNALELTCPELYYLNNTQLEKKLQIYLKTIKGV